jgi:Rab-GTPase-TBC domain
MMSRGSTSAIPSSSRKRNQSNGKQHDEMGDAHERHRAKMRQYGHRVDKFGFIINMDQQGVMHDAIHFVDEQNQGLDRFDIDRVPTFRQVKKTNQRTAKWQAMMSAWHRYANNRSKAKTPPVRPASSRVLGEAPSNAFSSSSSTFMQGARRRKIASLLGVGDSSRASLVLRRRARKGIPDSQRGTVWKLLARVAAAMDQNVGVYQSLVKQCPSLAAKNPAMARVHETIERDIHRTYPRHCMFYNHCQPVADEADQNTKTITEIKNRKGTAVVAPSNGSRTKNDLTVPISMSSDTPTSTTTTAQSTASRRSPPPQVDDDVQVMCGAEEISNMIRELEMMSGASPTKGANGKNSPTKTDRALRRANSLNDAEAEAVKAGLSNHRMSQSNNDRSKTDSRRRRTKSATVESRARSNGLEAGNGQKPSNAPATQGDDQHGIDTISPSHSQLTEYTDGQASLRRVLKAYSLYDASTGYCQGMNFIAAMFLTLMSEEESFWMLVGTCENVVVSCFAAGLC